MFVGRQSELQSLNRTWNLNKSSLVICRGRRRIGKSQLIREFGKKTKNVYEFQGLPPRKGQTAKDQILNFYSTLSKISPIRLPLNLTWSEAFSDLTDIIKTNKNALIFFDEISWMGTGDLDFPGYLKIAWDTHFSKLKNTMFVICGSVSTWIEENILSSTAFVGRVSLVLTLDELPLPDSAKMLKTYKGSDFEKLRILCLTGGVPKYLEEVHAKESLFENVKSLFYNKSGFLFNDFGQIFDDIFLRKSDKYRQVVTTLIDGHKTVTEISKALKIERGGLITQYMRDLTLSGFISEDVVYDLSLKVSKVKYFRLKDNYLRFYLKYVHPKKQQIKDGTHTFKSFESLPGIESILGLQFENLILNNRLLLLNKFGIDLARVKSISPYTQKHTVRNKGACQIDLLIHLEGYELIVCEIKLKAHIPQSTIQQIEYKKSVLKRPKHYSVRTALIYMGTLASLEVFESSLDFVLSAEELLY